MKKLLLLFLIFFTLTATAQIGRHGRIAIVNGVAPPTAGANRLAAPVLSSTVPGTTQVNLSWTLADARTTSYTLERATDNMFTANLTTVYTGNSRSYSNTSLTTGTEYFYRVKGTASGLVTSSYGVEANIPGATTTVSFPGSGNLAIDCSGYAAGTTIHITPGTYTRGIDISNGNGHVIDGTGVILQGDGTSGTYYNVISVNSCNKTIIKGIKTSNIGYFSFYISGSNSGGNNGIVLDGLIFQDCTQGANFSSNNPSLTYAKTDASTYYLDFSRINCQFIRNGGWVAGNSIVSGVVKNLFKNWLESNNYFFAGDPQDVLDLLAIKNYQIYNNRLDSVNKTNNFDNRLYKMVGYGDFFDNYATNYQGHVYACWSVGFGDSTYTKSNCHNNIFIGSYKYSGTEFQQFTDFKGSTTFGADMAITNNTMGNLNTSNYMGFDARIIDSYVGNPGNIAVGGSVLVVNNLGFTWLQPPIINPATGRYYVSNNSYVTTDVNNLYTPTQAAAIDVYLNSLFAGVGAY